MADTEQHYSPIPTVLDEVPEAPKDWKMIDRLIILMSLAVTQRFLRRSKKMDPEMKIRILDRLEELIEEYKQPHKPRKPETW